MADTSRTAPRADASVVIVDDGAAGRGVRVRSEAGDLIDLAAAGDSAERMTAYVGAIGHEGTAPAVVVIVGGGLGHLAAAVRTRWPAADLVIVEPMSALAETSRDAAARLVGSAQPPTVVGPDQLDSGDLWRLFDVPGHPSRLSPLSVAHPVLTRAMPEAMKRAARAVGRAVGAARMNAQARSVHAGRYLLNTLRNLSRIARGPDLGALEGAFRGVPAIVIGAGPSLDGQLDALADVATRALVIATDTAWRPLARVGIDPHLVVALDPTAENGAHLRHVAVGRAPWLIAEGSVDPASLATLAGRVAAFRVARHPPWPWLQSMGIDKPLLRAFGSVLTTAFDVAVRVGADPIVFVGADLAFTEGRPYCRGTTHEEGWTPHVARGVPLAEVWRRVIAARDTIEATDVHGRSTITAPHLLAFRDWIVAAVRDLPERRVVNASQRGVLHGPGIALGELRDIFTGRPEVDGDIRASLDGAFTAAPDRLPEGFTRWSANPAVPAAVRAEWRVWTDGIDDSAVDEAIGAGVAEPNGIVRPAVRLRWPAADRVAAMRAILLGRRPTVHHGPHQATVEGARDAAIAVIDSLLAAPRLVGGVTDDTPTETVPLSCRFAWLDGAAPLVAALEEHLIDLHVATETRPESPGYWTGPIALPTEADAGHEDIAVADDAARAALLAERLAVAMAGRPTASRSRRLIEAVRRASTAGRGSSSIELCIGDSAALVTVPPAALMRAATGTLVRRDASLRDPRRAFFGAEPMVVDVRPLTDEGCPTGWSVASGPDTAVLVPSPATDTSLRIDADGLTSHMTTWPGVITGQAPWRESGALAWNSQTGEVFWRAAADEAIRREALPFCPIHFAQRDDQTFWTDLGGGLWRWVPGENATRVATLPGSGIPRVDGDVVIVGPTLRGADGRVTRTRLRDEWRVDPRTGRYEVVPADPEGQGGKTARRLAWTATTYPFSDVVRLDSGARSWWLACHAPLGVAWAGPSLVVTTAFAEVLLFIRLHDRLAALDPGAELASA